jgi:hypothetical protein
MRKVWWKLYFLIWCRRLFFLHILRRERVEEAAVFVRFSLRHRVRARISLSHKFLCSPWKVKFVKIWPHVLWNCFVGWKGWMWVWLLMTVLKAFSAQYLQVPSTFGIFTNGIFVAVKLQNISAGLCASGEINGNGRFLRKRRTFVKRTSAHWGKNFSWWHSNQI